MSEAINNPDLEGNVFLNGITYIGTAEITITQSNIAIYGGFTPDDDIIATLNADKKSRIMNIQGNNITFKNINFINGNSSSGGAIFVNSSSVSFINCNFINNTASDGAGASIYFNSSSDNCSWKNCIFINNRASFSAIYFDSGSNNSIWENCTFKCNNASTSGGAISIAGSNKNNTWINCYFTNNTASNGAGAILLDSYSDNNIWINCSFTNNTASDGGAIYLQSTCKNNNWINCSFENNSALSGKGGAIYFVSGDNNTLDYCNFTGNKAFKGSAIYTSSNLIIDNCILTDNRANATDINFNLSGFLLNITLKGNNNILDAIFAEDCDVKVNGTDTAPTDFVSGKINLTGLFGLLTIDSGDVIDLNKYNYPTKINATHYEDTLYTYVTNDYSLSYNVTVDFDVDDFSGANGTDVSGLVNVTIRGNSSAKVNITSFNVTISQNGTVILSFNSVSVDEYGKITITLPSKTGKYNLTIIPTDSNYNCTHTTKEIIVKLGAMPVISPSSVMEEENFTITVKFPTDVTGNVTVTIGNQTVNGTLTNGTISLNFTGLKAGTYDIFVTYSGDENYDRFENLQISTLKVTAKPPAHKYELKADDVTKFINGTECYVVTLTDYGKPLAGQEILITLNGKEYTRVTDEKGTATLDLDLPVGTYTVTAKWHRFTTKNTITVKANPISYELTAKDVDKYFGSPERYTVTLTENGKALSGETITITVNGKSYSRVTDENGTASMSINLNVGEYSITASWKDLTVKNTVTVKTTVHADDFTKYYLNGTQYEAYVLDSEGKPLDGVTITFNIHGVFYHKEAHNGKVKLNINLLPGEYIITAYNDVTGEASSATVTVLPTLIGSDLNMTYKDGSAYECKLVDGQGTPVKGAELTFNIHGVFYHKTTDDNGIARLNINLLLGEYIITAIYDELTITSNKITVRDL